MFCLCTLYISQEDSSSSIYFLDSKATMLLKSFSSQFKLILESVNSQYDDRLFIDLRLQYRKNTSLQNMLCTNIVLKTKAKTKFVHNMF